ncbi:MAG: response regulator transcription factor [Bifidobacteriaceae bacterium]|jgi:two-component system response regulator RegX3|nr:response regulator transcription factor [Bifidobacteriaceae bacterium]
MTDLLLVEDDETQREALAFLLGREGYQVRTAADGAAALAEFEAQIPELVLLDLMIPVVPGTEVCRRIRLTSNVPVIMLTAKSDEADVVVGLELGADDYVTKPYSTLELLARCRRALRRHRALRTTGSKQAVPVVAEPELSHRVIEVAGVRLDPERHRVWVDGEEVNLPLREFSLLEVLMEHAGRVLTRPQLLDRVWGADFFGDTKTLDVHIRRLRSRIEPQPASPARLVTVRGLGYRFEEKA